MSAAKIAVVELIVALGFVLPMVFAQKTGGGSKGPPPPALPTITQPLDRGGMVMFITGKVATDDGTPVPRNIVIERVCDAGVRQQVRTSSSGDFSMQLGSMVDTLDASVDVQQSRRSSMRQAGVPRSTLRTCELRASVSGYRSSVVSLGNFTSNVSIDVGTIVVQRGEKAQGTTLSATGYEAPKDAKKSFEKGLEAEKKGKFEDAQKYLEKAVAIYPRHANAWFELGKVFEQEKEMDAARNAYSQAISADPRFVPPYLTLARIAGEAHKWSEVLDLTSHALALDPLDYPDAFFLNAAANYNLRNVADAEKRARAGERLDAQNRIPQVHLLLASILRERHDYSGAIAEIQTYLKVAPRAKNADQVRLLLAELEKAAADARAEHESKQ